MINYGLTSNKSQEFLLRINCKNRKWKKAGRNMEGYILN